MVEEKIKEGYKRTEIGIIPEDWEVTKLSKVINKKPEYGINAAAVPYNDSLPTYLRITDISEDGNFIYTNKVSVYNNKAENFYLHKDDIVFARTGASTGKTYLYKESDGKLVFAGFLIRVNINNKYMDARYIKAFTETKKYWNWVTIMSMRSGQPGINGNEYSQLKLPMPPLKEQYAIADVISDINNLIQFLEKLIEKKKKIKQGTMQQLLTGKKRLPGFSDEWNNFILSDLIYIQGGYSFKSDYFTKTGVPIIRISNIQNAVIDMNDVVYYQNYSIPKSFCVNQGDVLIAMSGATTGKVGIYKNEIKVYLNQRVGKVVIKDNNKAYLPYISQLFQTNIFQLALEKSIFQGAQPNISGYQIEALSFFMPICIEEQKRIAEILADIDSEIEALEQKLKKYKKIKQGMMQELLTGRIRLV